MLADESVLDEHAKKWPAKKKKEINDRRPIKTAKALENQAGGMQAEQIIDVHGLLGFEDSFEVWGGVVGAHLPRGVLFVIGYLGRAGQQACLDLPCTEALPTVARAATSWFLSMGMLSHRASYPAVMKDAGQGRGMWSSLGCSPELAGCGRL
ncbi:Trehalose-phosphate phosphatase [Hordeum vulgare]|nr:Trehalose-phosphate phosphatase [Hordeum vulgare]